MFMLSLSIFNYMVIHVLSCCFPLINLQVPLHVFILSLYTSLFFLFTLWLAICFKIVGYYAWAPIDLITTLGAFNPSSDKSNTQDINTLVLSFLLEPINIADNFETDGQP